MWGGRAPWLVLATLMSAAAAAAAGATHLHWLPCSDAMLNGSVFNGYRYDVELTDACLRRMDAGLPFPFLPEIGERETVSAELAILAISLLGLAWVVFIAAQRWALRVRAVAALPGLMTCALAGVVALTLQIPGWSGDLPVSAWLALSVDLTALLAVAVIVLRSEAATRTGYLVALWGVASFGWMRTIGDYALMIWLSNANWDSPPGTGYVTAATIALSGMLALGFGLRGQRRVSAGLSGATTPLPRLL